MKHWGFDEWFMAFLIAFVVTVFGFIFVAAWRDDQARGICQERCFPGANVYTKGRCLCELGDGWLLEVAVP